MENGCRTFGQYGLCFVRGPEPESFVPAKAGGGFPRATETGASRAKSLPRRVILIA